jgi:methyl-accepting chemotaxis protein
MASPSSSTRQTNENRPGVGSHDISGMGHKAQEQFGKIGEQAKETASSLTDQAKSALSSVAQGASDVACNVGQKAEDMTGKVGSGMQSLAQTIRGSAPNSGMIGQATGAVASTLERGGRYLEQEGLQGMGEDLTDLIRRNPIPALLVGIGLGFLLARATRS